MSITIKRVDISGMHRVTRQTYDFEKLNYLKGMNGAGKSTVLEAIQLALFGYIPGKGKTKELVFRHANGHMMAVALMMHDNIKDEDISILRTWQRTAKGIESNVTVHPINYTENDILSWISDIELPVFNFNEFASMTANKLKEWFVGFIPKPEDDIDWKRLLRDHVSASRVFSEDLFSTVVECMPDPKPGVDGVREVHDYMKQALSFKKSELERVSSTIQELVYYDVVEPVSDISMLMDQKKKLVSNSRAVDSWKAVRAQNARVREQLATIHTESDSLDADTAYAAKKQQVRALGDKQQFLESEIAKVQSQANELRREIGNRRAVLSSRGTCPYSNQSCDTIVSMCGRYEEELKLLTSQLTDAELRVDEMNAEKESARRSQDALCREVLTTESAYAQKSRLLNMISEEQDIDESWLSINFTEAIEQVDELLVKLQANQRYNDMVDMMTKQKYQIEMDIECIKSWIALTGANGMQSRMMAEPFERFAEVINKYLSYTMRTVSASFHVEEKANSFSFGIKRNDEYIPFDLLSSGEKCLYTLAMLIAIVSNSDGAFKVILVDDLLDHLDDDNIDTLFRSLNDIPEIQFIVAGVKHTNEGCINLIEIK